MSRTIPKTPELRGLMFIGDPHLESRVPGFRKDDYPTAALNKFRWCLEFAEKHCLQPFLLGDLFQLPQDNPNWLIAEIIDIINEHAGGSLPAIYGNHDVRENSLKRNDSISILFAGGHLKQTGMGDVAWSGTIEGLSVSVSGTVWGERIPDSKTLAEASGLQTDLSVLMTHHDILIPGYEEGGRIRPRSINQLDLVINGHIHRRLDVVSKDRTHWVTAGNITRRSRSDASRSHTPAVPCITPFESSQKPSPPAGQLFDKSEQSNEWDSIHSFTFESQSNAKWSIEWVRVPHKPFDDVFHPAIEDELGQRETGSEFIKNLRELTLRRTDSGAGLTQYLEENLSQFDQPVADQIWKLARQVAHSNELNTSRST